MEWEWGLHVELPEAAVSRRVPLRRGLSEVRRGLTEVLLDAVSIEVSQPETASRDRVPLQASGNE
jgi:hypothetical protein